MDFAFSWIVYAGAIAVASKLILLKDKKNVSSLEWEGGRRKAKKEFHGKPTNHARYGIREIEEYVVNSRGVEIFTKKWLPAKGSYKGLVVYCHGYGDTCSYFFEDVATRLAAAQYAVAGMDYEGHGQSQGRHVHIRKFETLRDDVIEFCSSLKAEQQFKDIPFFLYGESMGGAVAIKVHLKQPDFWQGAILSAPMCKIADDMIPPAFLVFILKCLAPIFPLWRVVPTNDILETAFKVKEKRDLAGQNPTAFKGKPRLWTALELLRVTDEIGKTLHNVKLPLLILHGENDTVTDPSISRELFEASCSEDKTLKMYPDSWHALTAGEPDETVDSVFGDIFEWLDKRSLRVDRPSLELWREARANALKL